jgi:hypothetical protein
MYAARPGFSIQAFSWATAASNAILKLFWLELIMHACHFHAMMLGRRSWRATKLPDQAFSVVKHLVLAWGLPL